MAVRILAKLSDFMCEYLHHISYTDFIKTAYTKDTKVVVQWTFADNELTFAQLFVNSSNVSVMNVSCPVII